MPCRFHWKIVPYWSTQSILVRAAWHRLVRLLRNLINQSSRKGCFCSFQSLTTGAPTPHPEPPRDTVGGTTPHPAHLHGHKRWPLEFQGLTASHLWRPPALHVCCWAVHELTGHTPLAQMTAPRYHSTYKSASNANLSCCCVTILCQREPGR